MSSPAELLEKASKVRKGPTPKGLTFPGASMNEIMGATPEQWASLEWRLDHLYTIVDKGGKLVRFVMNDEQRDFIRNFWHRNIILKARQLGFSTLMQVLALDQSLMNEHHNAVVITDTLPNAGRLFAKVELAYTALPGLLRKSAWPIKAQTSKSLLEFANGSSVSVSTSARGGTVQLLHVSELGKIARKYPLRAKEVVSGSFESVASPAGDKAGGAIVVESTAEGAFGEFWDLTEPAIKRWEAGDPETVLDWRLHFYPWFKGRDYRLTPEDADLVLIEKEDVDYFEKIEQEMATILDRGQRAWYIKKRETQGRAMKQEYPSTPREAFEQAVEGSIFGAEMTKLRERGRIAVVPLDANAVVNTFWDLGWNDTTAIWFHQKVGLQNRFWWHLEDSHTSNRAWWTALEKLREDYGFRWGKHYMPHDADAVVKAEDPTDTVQIYTKLGMRNIVVVPRIHEKATAIDLLRAKLPTDVWIDKEHCPKGIRSLDGYQYEWNEKRGAWSNEPFHNWASNSADAMMQFAQAFKPSTDEAEASIKKFKNRKRSWR